MNQRLDQKMTIRLDFKWIVIGYAFFLVYHLLPWYFLSTLLPFEFPRGSGSMTFIFFFWIFFGLAVIGFFIGYLSKNFTVIESGLAGLLYLLTLWYLLPKGQYLEQYYYWGFYPTKANVTILVVSLFLIATVSAWVGEAVQMRKMQKISTDPAATSGG
jgi:hypothetical protein